MEDKKAKIIAGTIIVVLLVSIIIARISLGLSNTFYLITGANGAAILAIITIFLLRNRWHSNSNRTILLQTQMVNSDSQALRIEYSFLRKVAGVPTIFKYNDIEVATDGFQTLLGKGGSGLVYKGILSDGTPVAVKRIEGRGEKEFRSEVAAIASVQHVNLVRLLGYCYVPSGSRFLVYDFIPKGSLDKWIFPPSEKEEKVVGISNTEFNPSGGCMDWCSRVRVAHDVAKALSYLHHDCRSRILHLDVKPENILLNGDFRGLVSDFGLSKLMGLDESRVVTMVRGTRGYLAPEWILQQGVSEKCDVYSYGIVLLEMVGGTRSCYENSTDKFKRRKFRFFPKIVRERLREGRVMEVVDKRVVEMGGVDEREVKRLVCVGLWCVQEQPSMRPSMVRVVEMLEGRAAVEEPPDTGMMMVNLLSCEEKVSPGDRDSCGIPMSPAANNDYYSSGSHSIYLSSLSGR